MIKVRKLFFAWQEDAEMKFLQEKVSEGYLLEHVGFGVYHFNEATPQKVVYQMDFKIKDKLSEAEYLQLFEDDGWHFVSKIVGWYYFYKEQKDEEVELSLFNNNQSKLEKYKRLILVLLVTGFPMYYQVLILFPRLQEGELQFPSFYFFLNIIVIILLGLHTFALLNIVKRYLKIKNNIKE